MFLLVFKTIENKSQNFKVHAFRKPFFQFLFNTNITNPYIFFKKFMYIFKKALATVFNKDLYKKFPLKLRNIYTKLTKK